MCTTKCDFHFRRCRGIISGKCFLQNRKNEATGATVECLGLDVHKKVSNLCASIISDTYKSF